MVQFLAVLGLCILVVVLLVWSFSWEDGVDPSEEGIWKSTGRRRRFTRESQYAEQTSLITSAKAFFAGVLFWALTERGISRRLRLLADPSLSS